MQPADLLTQILDEYPPVEDEKTSDILFRFYRDQATMVVEGKSPIIIGDWHVSVGRTGRVAFAREVQIRDVRPQLRDAEGRRLYIDPRTGEKTLEAYSQDERGYPRSNKPACADETEMHARPRYNTDGNWLDNVLGLRVTR